MGQCPAAQSPEREDDELAALDPPVPPLELARGQLGHGDDRALGEVAIAFGDRDRIAMPGDKLHAEREAALANRPPQRVHRLVEGLPAGCREQAVRRRPRVERLGEGRPVDQPVEQARPPRELLRQRRRVGKHQRERFDQLAAAPRAGGTG